MSNQSIRTPRDKLASSWSNRILILAAVGILFLTLYPFRFSFHVLPNGAWPLFLGKSRKSGLLDAFLNVLLFVPFGFGLAEKLRERGRTAEYALTAAFFAGALFSYTIEFLQLYIPERDSGWEDVFTNGSGSLLGSIVYFLIGSVIIRALTSVQRFLLDVLSLRRVIIVLMVYFGLWCGLAAFLQKQTRLSNWRPDAMLVLGNDGAGQNPWRGQIKTLQIWDHALGGNAIPNGRLEAAPPIVEYDFSAPLDSAIQSPFVPKLFWIPGGSGLGEQQGLVLDGKSWLSTKIAVGDLIESLQKTNHFTIHVVCTPTDLAGADGRIVSLSNAAGIADMTLRQDDVDLVFWFRTPLAARRALLAWYVPGVFRERRERDIWYSYDGSNLLLTLDGKPQRLIYRLGPGTGLARVFRIAKSAELEGYMYIFYALVFVFGGALLGSSALHRDFGLVSAFGLSSLILWVSAWFFERVLVSVSGRIYSWNYLIFSVVLGLTGFLWSVSDLDFRPRTSKP